MASQLRFPLTQLLILVLSNIAAVVADPMRLELSTKISKHSPSDNLQPHDFPNEELYRNYLVIQRFKRTIISDPKNITATWTGNDICGNTTYLGFYCAELPGSPKKLSVTAVIFNGYGLRAPTLKGFIDDLPDLALLHAASNDFGGNIPYLTGLAYNYKININSKLQTAQDVDPKDSYGAHARGTGNIGCVKFDLDITVYLRPGKDNKKGGSVPGATDSKALLLNYNHLSGQLPADLGFSKLSYLAVANNNLTGPIPPSISHLQNSLLEVLLLNNQLSGCLPHELGMLTKAAVIDAGMNQLTGPIPSSFSCLTSVEQLNLAGNRLYGDIPDALCKHAGGSRLANLTLSGNYFTSVSPACALLIKDGVLDVKNNCIPGLANQRRPVECAAFLSQPKTCPAVSATHAACPAAAAAPASRVAKDYSSYVTYATLHQ